MVTERITWLVDELLLDKHDDVGFPSLGSAAEELGHNVIKTKYVPLSEGFDSDLELELTCARYDGSECLVTYGTVGFLNQFEKFNKFEYSDGGTFCPGSYYKKDNLKYSMYSTIYGRHMLNDDYIMLPYGEIKRRWSLDLVKMLNSSGALFIRPDTVTKSFAGRVFPYEDLKLENLGQASSIHNNEACIIAAPKKILSEYRHVICDGELVAQSQYRRNGVLDIRTDVAPECQSLAKYVARSENELDWQPDFVYVVDTAMTNDGAKIIEFNSFSCSGLYACDTRRIVDHVSYMAVKEYKGDI